MIHKKNKHNIIISKRMDDSKDIPTKQAGICFHTMHIYNGIIVDKIVFSPSTSYGSVPSFTNFKITFPKDMYDFWQNCHGTQPYRSHW